MDNWQIRSLNLVLGLGRPTETSPSVIPYAPAKTTISGSEKPYFRRTRPEHYGISSRRFISMLTELEADVGSNVHSIMVLQNGAVICEASHPAYDVNTWHLSHSMSKTVTAIAVGMLVDDGRLNVDERLVDFFPDVEYRDSRFSDIRVKHLLAMNSGVSFNEVGSVTESEWTKAFFASQMLFDVGEDFAYNSMNSYILSRIVCKITEKSLAEFLRERLFEPLRITNYFWEKSPEGYEKGGWGLYMSPESWAKLGQLFLNLGRFEGKRIISSQWIRKMTSTHSRVASKAGDFDYGYHVWVNRKNDEFLFNGMLGQNVWVCPRNNIVVAVTAGNGELFQQSSTMAIVRKYLSRDINDTLDFHSHLQLKMLVRNFYDMRRYAHPLPRRRGPLELVGMRPTRPFDTAWSALVGRTYAFRTNHVGLLPLFVRCMQNNLAAGISFVSFDKRADDLVLTVREGDTVYDIEVGFYDYKYSMLNFRGEKYIVGAMGHASADEYRHAVYKIELIFPELPNTRRIKLSIIDNDRLHVAFSEVPDDKLVTGLFTVLPITNPRLNVVIKLLEARIGDNFISSKIEDVFNPSFICAEKGSKRFREIMEREEARAKETSSVMKTVNSIITRLMKELDEDAQGDEPTERERSLISNIIAKIKRRRSSPAAPIVLSKDTLIEDVNYALRDMQGE